MIILSIILTIALLFSSGCVNEVLQGQVETAQENEILLKKQLEETEKRLAHQDIQNEELVRQQAELQQETLKWQTQYEKLSADLTTQNQNLLAKNEELMRHINETEQKIQTRNVSFQKIPNVAIVPNNSEQKMSLNFNDSKLFPLRYDRDNIIIELQDVLLFEPGTLTLSDSGKKRLQNIAGEIKRNYPNLVYNIVGHTDFSPDYNEDVLQEYSLKKAGIVINFLIHQTGIHRNQLILTGSGSICPIVSNDTEINRERNRRIEWVICSENVYKNSF
ncbi:MAG: OmpA family protein [Planctomycetia bacterium]|nr:OmpA family protein [Planctomycetia bacterium]